MYMYSYVDSICIHINTCISDSYTMYMYSYTICTLHVSRESVAIDSLLQCVAVCCSVLQCDAVCCNMLQCVAVCCSCNRLAAETLIYYLHFAFHILSALCICRASLLESQQHSYILSTLCVSYTICTLRLSSESIRVSAALLYTICTLRLLLSLSSCSRFYSSFREVGRGQATRECAYSYVCHDSRRAHSYVCHDSRRAHVP